MSTLLPVDNALAASLSPTLSAIPAAQTVNSAAPPPPSPFVSEQVSLQNVAQYSSNVYSVLANTISANQAPMNSAAYHLAQINLNGVAFTPPPPAEEAAGIPYVAGANHNDFAAQTMASLRSLSGNGTLFGQ